MDDSGVILLIQALINTKIGNKWVINSHSHLVLAMVPDRHFGSGSGSELNCRQIGCPGCQYTLTVNSGPVRCKSPNPSELGGLSAGRPVGPSVDLYNVLVLQLDKCMSSKSGI